MYYTGKEAALDRQMNGGHDAADHDCGLESVRPYAWRDSLTTTGPVLGEKVRMTFPP